VAHHGSAYQDPALLDAVAPAVALVSVGADNPYGHPNAGLLAGLARAGVRVLRTDRDGDVAVVATDHGLAVVRARAPPTAIGVATAATNADIADAGRTDESDRRCGYRHSPHRTPG
jgi:competence protein ComEC